ncbi:hypothetical protein PR202_gb10989 [Eleusine coracana subsp. coracana]|uniref:protein-serine/threonine phosphatase n=1 Tax=Eleusine coracana subsp. coracana TaxID=191504 RepID=A0AAV5ELV9_ELECO|nr:hypothetical protein PR202_gb10989 [Eleusine coracana subsp. coracana]
MAAAGGSKAGKGYYPLRSFVRGAFKGTSFKDVERTCKRLDYELQRLHHVAVQRPLQVRSKSPARTISEAFMDLLIHVFDKMHASMDRKKLTAAAACVLGAVVLGFFLDRWARRTWGGGARAGLEDHGRVGVAEEEGEGEEDQNDEELYHIRVESPYNFGCDENSAPVTFKLTVGGSNDQLKYAASSMQGWGQKMEDAVSISEKRLSSKSMDELLKESDELMCVINPLDSWDPFLRNADCANGWRLIKAPPNIASQKTIGSTACVVAIRDSYMVVGNIGDSRCMISKNGLAIELSTQHTPNKPVEKLRIQVAGGQVTRDKFVAVEEDRILRQRPGLHKVNGILPVSRSLVFLLYVSGDFAFKQNKNLPPAEQMVTCMPDCDIMEITSDTEFCVIGSHALWDSMPCQEVVDFVNQHLSLGQTNLRVICERLINRCLASMENVTAILVQFQNEG